MDATDARLLRALIEDPRGTVLSLADKTGLSRNTVHGYPLSAFISVTLVQQHLDEVAVALARIPEVLQVLGMSGGADLLVLVAARTADDLYRIAGMILATPGVERTETSLIMRQMVDYRVHPLLDRLAQAKGPST